MKRSPVAPAIEALESRIAPAALGPIFVGDEAKSDTTYDESPFVNINETVLTDPISAVVGNSGGQKAYYLKLGVGDSLWLRTAGTQYSRFISSQNPGDNPADSKVRLATPVIAFFVDKDNDGRVDADELTGISLTNGASVAVGGVVNGDVVSNLNSKTGKLGGANEALGGARDLLENTITAFSASGGVTGSIISGGAINSIPNVLSVKKILTGNAANGVTFDFNGAANDGGDTLSVVPAAGKRGVNINKVVASRVEEIRAGGGGSGAAGGAISGVTLLADTDGFVIQAGAGGAGLGAGRGGAGGAVSGVVVYGLQSGSVDGSPNSATQISGGDGGASGLGTGGAGGAVSRVNFGYEPSGSKLIKSATPLMDQVLIAGGIGGQGRTGGAGGAVRDAFVFSGPTGNGNNIVVRGGEGGDAIVSGGVAGSGGSVMGVDIQNPGNSTASQSSVMRVDAGDSGSVVGGASGGAGGSVSKVFMVGFRADINAGNGGTGVRAGLGGSVEKVTISDGFQGVFAERVEIDAGRGGIAFGGSGGSGGKIDGVTVLNADLEVLNLNAGDGGDGLRGAGGAGGGVGNLNVVDLPGELGGFNSGLIQVRAGRGGDGGDTGVAGNGGRGGSVFGVNNFTTDDLHLVLAAGAGGAAKSSGSGGAGGEVRKVAFAGAGQVGGGVGGVDAFATVTAGNGGLGALNGAGGAGGLVASVNVLTPGKVTVSGGVGGNGGAAGAAGAGGAVGGTRAGQGLLLQSGENSVDVIAGSSGVSGGKSGMGGGVTNVVAYAAVNLNFQGGAGSLGGRGGSLSGLGFFGVDNNGFAALTATPLGNVSLLAGNGSASGNVGGAGGDVSNVNGNIGLGLLQKIAAGQGGGGGSVSANGGNVSRINITGGGGSTTFLTIEAGDAGDAPSGRTGGRGGSVSNVIAAQFQNLGTKIRNIVAGDGGDAGAVKARGGAGGSVTDVNVQSDIGIRSGVGFGYDQMGGIFAGAGGVAAAGTAGLSGSVDDVNANAIAAIAAGKITQGSALQERNLAAKVSRIVLNGTNFTKTNKDGSYTDFGNDNVLGGVKTPGGLDANKFKFTDTNGNGTFGVGDTITANTDGFVAALNFDQKTMGVSPEAVLKRDADGVIRLTDLDQRPS